MRQWMVDPKNMCRKHLLGEHVEHHMIVGTMSKQKRLTGYIENNLLEPLSLTARHAELVSEMDRRGYKHRSPLNTPNLRYLSEVERVASIDRRSAEAELFRRCAACMGRIMVEEKEGEK